MNIIYLLTLSAFLASCASRVPVGTAPLPPSPTRPSTVHHQYLEASDQKRVRHPEFVKTYHLGRRPAKGGRVMHEAHQVYQLEKSPRWNLLRNNPRLRSLGPVDSLRDSAYRPLPQSNQLRAEQQRQRELTQELETAREVTTQQLEAVKTRLAGQDSSATVIARLSKELKQERQTRLRLEQQLKTSQPPASNESDNANTNSRALREWGEDQPGQ